MTFEVGDRSTVDLNLITNAWPPILLALPGRIWAVVTPPAIASSYDASCVLRPSILRSQGRIGEFRELPSFAPTDTFKNIHHGRRMKRTIEFRTTSNTDVRMQVYQAGCNPRAIRIPHLELAPSFLQKLRGHISNSCDQSLIEQQVAQHQLRSIPCTRQYLSVRDENGVGPWDEPV